MRRIGSTDCGVIAALYDPPLALDLPKKMTATDCWLYLRWGLKRPSTKPMDRGLNMEQWGLDYYARHVGPWWRALPLGQWWTITDPANPWFTASPDAYDAPTPRTVIELKTWNETWGRKLWGTPGTDEIATRYHYQAQWLMARSGTESCHVLCIFGNDVAAPHGGGEGFAVTEPAIYPLWRDDGFIARLDAHANRFLEEFVLPGIPPPVKPAHNRREMKARLINERGSEAVEEWQQRCAEFAAAHGTDELGRPVDQREDAGAETCRSDGLC